MFWSLENRSLRFCLALSPPCVHACPKVRLAPCCLVMSFGRFYSCVVNVSEAVLMGIWKACIACCMYYKKVDLVNHWERSCFDQRHCPSFDYALIILDGLIWLWVKTCRNHMGTVGTFLGMIFTLVPWCTVVFWKTFYVFWVFTGVLVPSSTWAWSPNIP